MLKTCTKPALCAKTMHFDTVELIMEFEKAFGISIPDDKAEQITTVGEAISYIEENAK